MQKLMDSVLGTLKAMTPQATPITAGGTGGTGGEGGEGDTSTSQFLLGPADEHTTRLLLHLALSIGLTVSTHVHVYSLAGNN